MMKKLSLTFATMAAAFCLFALSAFAMGTDLTVVNADCHLRIGPGTNYDIIATIPSGSQVYINTANDGNGWAYITYNDQNGWTASRFLLNQQSTAAPAATSSKYTTYTMSKDHYLRSGPGTNYGAYVLVPAGSTIYVQYVTNGWALSDFGNYEGYIAIDGINGLGSNNNVIYTTTGNTYNGNGYNTTGGTWYGGCNYANVYDYNYYRSNNPDLVASLGDNTDAYLAHFVNYGMAEGRQAISSFNVYSYRNQHPDLYSRFGDDLPSYYKYACGLI